MSITPELVQYVFQARRMGMTKDQIRDELAKKGWDDMSIDEVLYPSPSFSGHPIVKVFNPYKKSGLPVKKQFTGWIILIVLTVGVIVGTIYYYFRPEILIYLGLD